MRPAVVIGLAVTGILVYDVAWPLVYGAFPSAQPILDVVFTLVAFLIPFVLGMILGRWESSGRAALLIATVGLVDSTAGWAISRQIAPAWTEIGHGRAAVINVATTIVAVVTLYGVVGLAGAATRHWWTRHESARAGR